MNEPGDGTFPAPDLAALPSSMLDEDPGVLLDWGRTVLADAGYRVLPIAPELRRRTWSTVARLETDRGPVWIKGNARDFGVEAALLVQLRRHAPAHVLPVIGVDPARCRLVTVDGGAVLSGAGAATEPDWIDLLTGYADLQQQLAPHVPELLRIGLPDLRPARLADRYRAALDRVDAEPVLSALLDRAGRAALTATIPVTESLAAELAADPAPATVEHNDLHPHNVFAADPTSGTGLRIFDWGDAVVTHPFLGLARTVAWATDADGATLRTDALRDAYLSRWAPDGAITPGLRRAVVVADALSPVLAAASWLRMPLADNPAWARKFVDFLIEHRRLAARTPPTPG